MAERVDEIPGTRGGGRPAVYPWAEWLNGEVWKLTRSVPVLVPVGEPGHGEMSAGDFTVDVEKMRAYARNASRRRSQPMDLVTRVASEINEYGTKVSVIYLKASPRGEGSPPAVEGSPTPLVEVLKEDEPVQQNIDFDGMEVVRQEDVLSVGTSQFVLVEDNIEDRKPVDNSVDNPGGNAEPELDSVLLVEPDSVVRAEPVSVIPESEDIDPEEWSQIGLSEDPNDPFFIESEIVDNDSEE